MGSRVRLVAAGAALALGCGGGGGGGGPGVGPVDMFASVDPFIGTGGQGFGVGSTYPGPALPFAMIHPGPDTRLPSGAPGFAHCSGYWYEDPLIEAFSLLRMNGTGVPDYGVVGLMPVDGMTAARTDGHGTMTPFSHDDEEAAPGYYRVRLASGIQVEITSTLRAALFRIDYPDGVDPVLVWDLAHAIGDGATDSGGIGIDAGTGAMDGTLHYQGDSSRRYGGFDVYVRAEVDTVPAEVGVWDEGGLHDGQTSASGVTVGGWQRFPAGTRTVTVRVATSYVDPAGAAGNLAAEVAGFDFDAVRAAAGQTWRDALGAVELDGARSRDGTLLATALYHTMLMPSLMSDVDGRYVDPTGAVATATRPHYSDFSLWDTYRTVHPWLLLADDAHNADFAASLIDFARVGGAYPRWALARGDIKSMVGSPADMVLAESAAKGVALDDEEQAYQYSRVTAYAAAPGTMGGRDAIADDLQYGYVPADDYSGSVAKTLEYAIADHALAEWARRLGHDTDASELAARAGNWRNLYDADTGFLRAKLADGSWADWPGAAEQDDAYTEGTAWQYLFMVPHDLDGLAETLGGREAALGKLRELFAASADETPSLGLRLYYWQGNEPDLIAPWAFAALGEPGESGRWIDWIFTDNYGTGPDGLPGNDDGGTMSAWLLFGAAGFYPIAGTDRYIVAAPRQALMVIHRPGGDLRIEAEPDPVAHPVPLEVTLDGVPVDGPELTHAQLAGAHVLQFTMAE